MLSFPKNIDSILLRSCIKRDNPTAFAMGFSYLSAAEFIRWPSTLGTPEGQLEQPQASGTREALWNGPPLTRGVRGVLCFSGVVRLLERAEEGSEGLKHGCYDLPCVCFFSSLYHDI